MQKNKKYSKKVLFVISKDSAFYRPYIEVFKQLRVEFKLFDYRKTIILEKFIFLGSIFYQPLYQIGTKMVNKRLIKTAKSYHPDLVLVVKGENISAETVNRVKQDFTIVNYFTDYFRWFSAEQIKQWLTAYQVVYTGDLFDVDSYKKKGFKNLYHVHLAGPRVKNIPVKKKYDVVFVGTYTKEREEMFKELQRLNFKIWGDKKWQSSSLRKCYMNKRLSVDETLEVFKNSKIVVNFHNDLTGKNRYINLRVYEVTAAKALLISDLRKDLPTVFKIGKEILIYKNKSDLKNKVSYYLQHERERKQIAQSGYFRCTKNHNYKNRLEQMFSVLPK